MTEGSWCKEGGGDVVNHALLIGVKNILEWEGSDGSSYPALMCRDGTFPERTRAKGHSCWHKGHLGAGREVQGVPLVVHSGRLLAWPFPKLCEGPSHIKDTYHSVKLACTSLLQTSISASLHYISHSINATNAKNKTSKEMMGVSKGHKEKTSAAGLCCVTAPPPDCHHRSSSPFPCAFPGLFLQQSLRARQ